jgi:hypothetical protein
MTLLQELSTSGRCARLGGDDAHAGHRNRSRDRWTHRGAHVGPRRDRRVSFRAGVPIARSWRRHHDRPERQSYSPSPCLEEPLRRVGVRPPARQLRRWDDGRVLASAPLAEVCERKFGAPYYNFHRAELHDVLARRAITNTMNAVAELTVIARLRSSGVWLAVRVTKTGTAPSGSRRTNNATAISAYVFQDCITGIRTSSVSLLPRSTPIPQKGLLLDYVQLSSSRSSHAGDHTLHPSSRELEWRYSMDSLPAPIVRSVSG